MAGKALYDVFLNFSGAYRKSFVNVLNNEMKKLWINVFVDEEELHEGDQIGPSLFEVIRATDIYIPIFTKDYASKKWCLMELKLMVEEERRSNGRKTILPIFFDVKPNDVQLKTREYTDDLKKLSQRKEHGAKEQVEQWRQSLQAAAKIKGFVYDKDKDSYTEFTQGVAVRVLSLLKQKVSTVLIGIDDRIKEVKSLLDTESADVRYLVIRGVPGVGKTTLAKAVFDRFSPEFEGSSFLLDIQESLECQVSEDLAKFLESQLLIDIPVDVTGQSVRVRYRDKKVLIVFDDVRKWKQIEKLVGSSAWFGSGSLIIITTMANENEIEKKLEVGKLSYASHKMSPMEEDEAVELFSWHAFRRQKPPRGDFNTLSRDAVDVVGGLPLGIKLLGSFLYFEDKSKWQETLEEIKYSKGDKINFILETSFKRLKKGEKEIFLDTACFFVGKSLTNPSYMWEACVLNGLDVLLVRSLITLVDDGQKLWMHNLLKKFGRDKVFGENVTDYISRSRFWLHDQALGVLQSKRKDKNAKAICLTIDEDLSSCGYTFQSSGFAGLNKVRFLRVHCAKFEGDLHECLRELTWLSWHQCPDDMSATNLHLKKLAILDLSKSSGIKHTWTGWEQMKVLRHLKVLDLTGCESLEKTPSFPKNVSMERLILEDCKMLAEIDRSIGGLSKLKYLNVRGCDNLPRLPDELCCAVDLREILISKKNHGPFTIPDEIGSLESLVTLEIANVKLSKLPGTISKLKKLESLSLSGCSGLKYLPHSIGELCSLTELDISSSEFVELPDTIGNATELRVMKMESSQIRTLPPGFWSLKKLEEIHAKRSKLEGEVPKEIEELSNLKILDFSSTKICRIRSEICRLSRLEKLDLESCDQISRLPSLPPSLITLRIAHTTHWTDEDISSSRQSTDSGENGSTNDGSSAQAQRPTKSKWIDYKTLLKIFRKNSRHVQPSAMALSSSGRWIENLTRLEELLLGLIPNAMALPSSFTQFDQLKTLDLCCQNLNSIPRLPSSLSMLSLRHCKEVTQGTISNLNNLSILQLHNCQVDKLGVEGLGKLVDISAEQCIFSNSIGLSLLTTLRVLYISGGRFSEGVLELSKLVNLKLLEVRDCNDLCRIQGLEDLKHIEQFILCGCSLISRLDGLSAWQRLQVFEVRECENLEHIDGQDYNPVPQQLKRLCKSFKIESCKKGDVIIQLDGQDYYPVPPRHRLRI